MLAATATSPINLFSRAVDSAPPVGPGTFALLLEVPGVLVAAFAFKAVDVADA